MKILCLDPSFTATGIVILTGNKSNWNISTLDLLKTSSSASKMSKADLLVPKSKRAKIRKNYDDLDRAIDLYNRLQPYLENADYACIEIPQIGGQDMQARSMWASGIMLGMISTFSVPIVRLTPAEVKNVTGNNTASKEDMCTWAYDLYPNAPWPSRKCKGEIQRLKTNHHIADALAAGVAGLTRLSLWN